MGPYAEIAVNAPVHNTYHYHLPPELAGTIQPGHLVRVGFGTAMQPGIVVALHETSPIEQTKPVIERLDPDPVMTPAHIAVGLWMSERYLAPPGYCLWLMLPPGITGRSAHRITLQQEPESITDPLQAQIIDRLKGRGSLLRKQLEKAIGDKKTRKTLEVLADAGVICDEAVLSPPGVRAREVRTAALAIDPEQVAYVARHLGRPSGQAALLEVIAANGEDPTPVDVALQLAGLRSKSSLNRLAEMGYIEIEKMGRGEPDLIFLAIPPEEVADALIQLRGGYKHYKILQLLAGASGPLALSDIYKETGATLNDMQRLNDEGLVLLGEQVVWRDSLAARDFVPAVAPKLTPEQRAVWETIEARLKAWEWNQDTNAGPRHFLLHGVTGSGKTEIYLHAIALALAQGRQAIFLVPEIALTAQTIRRVAERFPGQVALVHGSLSHRERYDTWDRARSGQVRVIVGTRSALFTPLPDVGVVILDEEHDQSYKQGPPILPPYYHAREVAAQLVERSGGVMILGSATPDIGSFYQTEQGQMTYLSLPQRIMGHRQQILELSQREGVEARYKPMIEDALTMDLPPVEVVDMRDELKQGNRSMFSRSLQMALSAVLDAGQQAMLYLNRRGQSTYVFCRDCGFVVNCPRCDTPMTYHRHGEAMRCHHCNYQMPPPAVCTNCGSTRVKYFGAGTQQVEAELKKLFPQARAVRWDADTATHADMHEAILQRFVQHEADIMIGTQMIAKGLDLPLVTLVGVVSADMGLALPDFRAGERVFQLLTQVSGRAGRGLLGGKVVLQTYQPDHYAVARAAQHDYTGFYEQEIAYRRDLGYPPFRRLVRILLQDPHPIRVQEAATQAANLLQHHINDLKLTSTELIGPAPCFFSRIDRYYRWHVLLRGPDPVVALRGMDIPRGWLVDMDPVDVL